MPNITLQTENRVAILTLTNSAKRNVLSTELLDSLNSHLKQISKSTDVRAVVLRAEGPVFSAGHDIRELVSSTEEELQAIFALCTEAMEAIRQLPQPVIAEVSGLATAAGCQLVASCDLVMASEDATFACPGVKIGLFCTSPGVAVSRAVGRKKAMEMLLTGEAISANEALQAGLVNRVVARDRLHQETLKLAQKIIRASPKVIEIGKRSFYTQIEQNVPDAYEFAERIMVENAQMPDAREGMNAFLEKREPKW